MYLMYDQSLIFLLCIFFMHWVFDFCAQDDWMALNKSKNNNALLLHAFIYSIWGILLSWHFWIYLFISHALIDYCTSRITSYLWKIEQRHYFFVMVGLDQFFHAASILLWFYWFGI